jgi:phytoene synthase
VNVPGVQEPQAAVSAEITRQSGSNLALAFILLPPEKRAAMSVLYAYCRQVDDVADEDDVPVARRAAELRRWREETRRACDGLSPSIPVVRELVPVIARHRLPFALFDDLLAGVEMDLVTVRYPDLASLERYCYHVASVVGLLSIEVFGYVDPGCRAYADALGKALQFTNILRDVGNDAQRGRIYLPQDALRAHGVAEADILDGRCSDGFLELARETAGHARRFFAAARAALPAADAGNMMTAELMAAVYGRLLVEIERRGFPVLDPRPIRLGRARKLLLILGTVLRWKLGLGPARHGV